MATIEKTTVIAAPAAQIFDFIADPHNLPDIWPSLVEVHDVRPAAQGGSEFRWTYRMAGMRLAGSTTPVEFAPPRRAVVATRGGIDSTITWTLEPEGDGTRVTVHTELTVPGSLLGRLAEPLVIRENNREAEKILANLKDRMQRR